MFFQTIFEVVEVINLTQNILLLLLKNFLQILQSFTSFCLYEGFQLFKFLIDKLLMNFIGLFNLTFIPFADGDTFVNFLNFLFGLQLKIFILALYARYCLF